MTEKDKRRQPLSSSLQIRIGKAHIAPSPRSVVDTKRELAEVKERVAGNREPILGSFRRIKLPRDPISLGNLIGNIAPRRSEDRVEERLATAQRRPGHSGP